MSYSYCFKFSLFLVLCIGVVSSASADIIHPDVMGETVWFTSISEGSPTGDPLPLYGEPTVSGNELDFPTTGSFAATSEGGSGPDQTDGKLTFMVEAKPGHFLAGIGFEEIGLTRLAAPFGGDALTNVEAFAVIEVNKVAGIPVAGPTITEFFDFDPDNTFQHSVDAGGDPIFTTDWVGTAGHRFRRPVTKVTVTLNNILFAATTSDDGTAALIDKKEFSVRVPTRVIPEPTTIVLGCLFGLVAIAVPATRML